MARNKGTFKFAATLEVQAANALDPRGVVNTKAELINKETWPYEGETIYVYNCMQVAVVEEKAVYMLIDPSKILESDYSGWKKIDASAATVVEVIDNLLSTNPNAALSANQGKILDDKISALSTKLTSIFKFKGSKDNLDAIQAIESPETGDVYHNSANGGEYVYDGTQWELLGLTISSETAPTSFDASAITSGIIALERLPKGALERLFIVSSENDAMRADCQEGDTVQVTGNDNKMYFCVNGSATTFANKFREYTAGAATSVPWSGVTGRPNVEDGAQKNVQSDWNAISGDAFILNKPTIPTKTSQLTNDSDFATQTVITTALVTKADKTEVEALLDRVGAVPQTYDIEWLMNLFSTSTDGTVTLTAEQFNEIKAAADAHKIFVGYGQVFSSSTSYHGDDTYIELTQLWANSVSTFIISSLNGTYKVSVTGDQIITQNELSGYAKSSDVPTKTSQLTNDSDYVNSAGVDNRIDHKMPVNVSQLANDAGYLDRDDLNGSFKTINGESIVGSGDIAVTAGGTIAVDAELSADSTNPVQNKVITGRINELAAAIPSKTSQLNNDSGYLTEHQSLDNYYTKEQTDSSINAVMDAMAALQSLIDTLNPGYQFMGVATPATNPGTPDQKVFYIANGKDTYTNFGGISITEDEVVILYYDTAWHKFLTGIASQEKLTELEGELHPIQEINGYDVATITNHAIKIDGSLQSAGLYRLLSIPNDNYTSIYGKASSYGLNSYYIVAFWNSLTPSTASLISGIVCQTSYVNQNFNIQIPSGTKLIGVTYYSTTGAAEVTLVKETHKLEEIEHEIAEIEENLPSQIQSEVSTAVAPFTKTKNAVDAMLESTDAQVYHPADFTEDGYYNASNTSKTSGYEYTSLPIINVVEGQTIYWHKWSTNPEIGTALAVCCYDNDGLPYNGVSARVNYRDLTTKDYETGEFTFVIPSNCSQIGVSFNFPTYPVQDGATFVVGDDAIELTQLAKDLINQAVEIDGDGGDRTAHFFLKGNSNIVYSSSKKLGIIAAGQSNIDGRNSFSDLPSGFVNPNSKVKICKNVSGTFANFEVTDGGAGNDWSFDAILYDALTNPSYGNQSEIYVIKRSMGGTSIDPQGATDYHWTAEYEKLTANHSLLRSFESYIRAGVNTQGSNFDIKAFIWHQGEGDADNADVASRYYENLKNMIAYVRGVVGNPRLHFFCGNLSNHNVVNPYRSVINEAYAKVASEDPYFHCIDMRDAVLEDSWHFNYQWSIYFGQKVYDEMIDTGIISGTKINPQKPIWFVG